MKQIAAYFDSISHSKASTSSYQEMVQANVRNKSENNVTNDEQTRNTLTLFTQ